MREVNPSTPLRVLVVDDCPDTTTTLVLLLRLWGHDTCVAHDGPSALAKAVTYDPDVVLLDIGLPGMDGHQVAWRLRLQPELERTLLVSLSGYGRDVDRRRSEEAGCDEHLVKPVEPVVLQRLLASRKATLMSQAGPPVTTLGAGGPG